MSNSELRNVFHQRAQSDIKKTRVKLELSIMSLITPQRITSTNTLFTIM